MKKLWKIIILVFCVLVFNGCNLFYGVSTSSSSSGSTSGETVTICTVSEEGSSKSTAFMNSTVARMSRRSKQVYSEASKSTVVVNACYQVSKTQYQEYVTSGFIFDKVEKADHTYTYYIMTSASGIFYRYVNSPKNTTLNMETDVKVVRNGDFEFVLSDGYRQLGELVGFNDAIDVAVFKFDSANSYPVLECADSNELAVGDNIYAIGTPMTTVNLMNTYVGGYISGLHRTTAVEFTTTANNRTYSGEITSYPSFQFDAPINYGMEGGPVLNEEGKVVGMISVKYEDEDESYESLSFAIESNIINNVGKYIINHPSKDTEMYKKPTIGVTVSEAANYQEKETWIVENNATKGLYIIENGVSDDSPAKKAGIQEKEVITTFVVDNKEYKLEGLSSLGSYLYQLKGTEITVVKTIDSEGNTHSYTVDLWS